MQNEDAGNFTKYVTLRCVSLRQGACFPIKRPGITHRQTGKSLAFWRFAPSKREFGREKPRRGLHTQENCHVTKNGPRRGLHSRYYCHSPCEQTSRHTIVASTSMRKARRFATETRNLPQTKHLRHRGKPQLSAGAARDRMSEGFDKSRVGAQSGNVGKSGTLVSEALAFLRKMTRRLVAHLMRRFQAIH